MYKRTLEKTIHSASESFPVLLVSGPRQVGKTTLLNMCADKARSYVTLDDFEARRLAQEDPALFLQTYEPPVIIDEVQYAPNLFSYIKIWVDRAKQNGLFWLTGSQKFHLMQGIQESLAGRIAIIDLLGFSQAEALKKSDTVLPFAPTKQWLAHASKNAKSPMSLKQVYEHIWLGGYPKLHEAQGVDRDLFYRSYVQTYIMRDVKEILSISDENSFGRFLVAVAARTGQLLNYADLARDIGIDNKTAKAWLSVLEASGLIYLLKPYFNNINKRVIKTPKLYFLDTGLCAYLTKWPDAASLEAGAMSGAILETYIFSEILKSYWHNGKEAFLYYYRDTDQKEVDLLIETGDTLYPVEFKKTATPSLSATKNFNVLAKLGKTIGQGAVICLSEKAIPLSNDVMVIPVHYL